MNNIVQTLTSLEVAEMVGKEHKNIVRDVRKYMTELGQLKIEPSDFFTESTYQNKQNKTMPCYQVTKKGCEFIAHKLTGIKGTEFTAKYINRFHEMEEQLQKANHMDWFVNDVRVFQHREFGILRVVQLDNKYFFIGKDITTSLGYVNNTDTLKKRVSDSEKCYISICDGNRSRKMLAVTEKGLFELINSGKLPLANKYSNWITQQVIPTLEGNEIVPVKTTVEQLKNELHAEVPYNIPKMNNPIEIFQGLLKVAESKGIKVVSSDSASHYSMLNENIINIKKELSFEQTVFELAVELSHKYINCNGERKTTGYLSKESCKHAERAAEMLIEVLNVERR